MLFESIVKELKNIAPLRGYSVIAFLDYEYGVPPGLKIKGSSRAHIFGLLFLNQQRLLLSYHLQIQELVSSSQIPGTNN